ncbi:MAG TPA: dihydrofolate reductase [Firmicutes bacterium]|nr:dihydrofolate reductase [Bacillota bacterium]
MISLIVAYDKNKVIGLNNQLPWHFKDDLKYFKETTWGHDIFMGRKTFDSILAYKDTPLPGRHNIVLTTSKNYDHYDITVVNDLIQFIKNYPEDKELFVIGGSSVYEQTLPYADRLYITHIDGEYEGDAYFPSFDNQAFKCIKTTSQDPLTFAIYERVK